MAQMDINMLLQSEYPGTLNPGTVYLQLEGFTWRAYAVSAYALFSAVPTLEPERVWVSAIDKSVIQVSFPRNEIILIGAKLEENGFRLSDYSPSDKYAVFSLPEGNDKWNLLIKEYRNWLFDIMLKHNVKFSA